jgi:CheY-like chemotaxis protein
VVASPGVDSETVRKYKATFQAPLSASKQEALQLLFGGDFDPVAMNMDMVGLDGAEA